MSFTIKFDLASLNRCPRRVSSTTVFKGIWFKFEQTQFKAGNKATNKVPQPWSGRPAALPKFGWIRGERDG